MGVNRHERKIIPTVTVLAIAERVVLGKLLEVCIDSIPSSDGIPVEILDGIERFTYGTTPVVFTPEMYEEIAGIAEALFGTHNS